MCAKRREENRCPVKTARSLKPKKEEYVNARVFVMRVYSSSHFVEVGRRVHAVYVMLLVRK
jgi:hypothetical protein